MKGSVGQSARSVFPCQACGKPCCMFKAVFGCHREVINYIVRLARFIDCYNWAEPTVLGWVWVS